MSRKVDIAEKELRRLYVKQKLSTYQIAKKYSCDPTLIQRRLKEYNIPLRNPKRRIDIPRNLLKELYWKGNLSTYEIAKRLNVGRTTIYGKLIEYGVGTRPKKIVNIPKTVLYELYVEKQFPLSKIAIKYNCSNSIILKKMRKYGIKSRDSSEANTIYPKKKFSGNPVEKAYMIGFRLGDLNARKHCNQITIKTNTTKREQVNLIKEVYGKCGHFYYKKNGGVFYTQCFLDSSFSFLLPKRDKIEDWILKNDKFFIAFLAGYTDAEGNIGIYCGRARFRVGSYDKRLLGQAYQKLKKMDIHCKYRLITKTGTNNQNGDMWGVSVNDKFSLLRLFELIIPHIKHEKRLNDIYKAKNNIMERNEKYGIKEVFIKNEQSKILRHHTHLLHQ